MLRPGNRFQTLLLHLFIAAKTLAEGVIANTLEGFVDLIEHITVRTGLTEQEFLGVGISSFVGKINRGIVVRLAAFLLRACDGFDELIATGQQFLLVVVNRFFSMFALTQAVQKGHLKTT